jgi:hypothetical protein
MQSLLRWIVPPYHISLWSQDTEIVSALLYWFSPLSDATPSLFVA